MSASIYQALTQVFSNYPR